MNFGSRRIWLFEDKPCDWRDIYGGISYPLTQRAWTLQERELSTRNIHFASDLILWECVEKKGSNQPRGITSSMKANTRRGQYGMIHMRVSHRMGPFTIEIGGFG
jgi:hypothetical protein